MLFLLGIAVISQGLCVLTQGFTRNEEIGDSYLR